MLFEITHHHQAGSANAAFAIICLINIFVIRKFLCIRVDEINSGMSLKNILKDDTARMIFGIMVMLFGILIRVGGWIPWKPMKIAGNYELIAEWEGSAYLWNWGGTFTATLGLGIILWPYFKTKYGRMALPLCLTGVGLLYASSLFMMEALSWLF